MNKLSVDCYCMDVELGLKDMRRTCKFSFSFSRSKNLVWSDKSVHDKSVSLI